MTTSRATVVVIDDDESVRKALRRLFSAAGYDVVVLSEARAYLQTEPPPPPACLVLDVRMPGMDGLHLQAAIRGTQHALPIVFITGHGDEEVRKQALDSGAVDVLYKPFDKQVLIAVVERALAAGLAAKP